MKVRTGLSKFVASPAAWSLSYLVLSCARNEGLAKVSFSIFLYRNVSNLQEIPGWDVHSSLRNTAWEDLNSVITTAASHLLS